MNRTTAILLLSLPLCLQACAAPGTYPSLAKRPAELVTGTAEPAPAETAPPEAPPPSEDLKTKVEGLVEQAKSAHGDFNASRDGTQRTIDSASGAARVSEGWVAAQVALASLEAARSGAITALSEIDQLYADERIAVPNVVTPSAALLESARGEVRALVDEESAFLLQLETQLGS